MAKARNEPLGVCMYGFVKSSLHTISRFTTLVCIAFSFILIVSRTSSSFLYPNNFKLEFCLIIRIKGRKKENYSAVENFLNCCS